MGRLPAGFGLALVLLLFGSVSCGMPAEGRIMGGTIAESGQWPWQVSLSISNTHLCGGTLIAPQWVVSAAHCFPAKYNTDDMDVVLGGYQLNNPSPGLIVSQVAELIKHPTFTRGEGFKADIALVKLRTPVTYSNTIRPICLPASSVSFPTGMRCTVTGWGHVSISTSLPTPKNLQQLEVPIIGTDTCKCLYSRNPDPEDHYVIHDDMICAGFAEGKKDACQGDSGGPLSCQVDRAWLLAGIVSWGVLCGEPNRPGLYANVSMYAEWIRTIVTDATLSAVTVRQAPISEEGICGPPDGSMAPATVSTPAASMAPNLFFASWILLACWALTYTFGDG